MILNSHIFPIIKEAFDRRIEKAALKNQSCLRKLYNGKLNDGDGLVVNIQTQRIAAGFGGNLGDI